jgi:hypothetical protein
MSGRPSDADLLQALATLREWLTPEPSSPTADEWIELPARAKLSHYGIRGRVVTDAARRGELQVTSGRPPRVRRSDLEAWLASRRIVLRAPASKTNVVTDDGDEYAALVEGARR